MKRKIILIGAFVLNHFVGIGQNILYKQTNKIMEYNYGVIDDSIGMQKMNEIEKIKYGLKFVEKSFSKSIDANYETTFEVKIDSNDYKQSWMFNLANRFEYTKDGTNLFDMNGELIKNIPYTDDEKQENNQIKEHIKTYGFHPGITEFPNFSDEFIQQLIQSNMKVEKLSNGAVKLTNNTTKRSTTFNKSNNTIIDEYTDKDGKKNKITKGYEPYLGNKGFLLKINKHERYLNLESGPCVTEVNLVYYADYNIIDEGQLIEKALEKPETINIYPNPNTGVFTAEVILNPSNSIANVKVINVLNGSIIDITNNNQNTFLVNLPNLATGQYVLQVITNKQKSLTVNFFKQ